MRSSATRLITGPISTSAVMPLPMCSVDSGSGLAFQPPTIQISLPRPGWYFTPRTPPAFADEAAHARAGQAKGLLRQAWVEMQDLTPNLRIRAGRSRAARNDQHYMVTIWPGRKTRAMYEPER